MIQRVYTRCVGCDRPTVVRVSVGYGATQPILVHCPNCHAPIRGTLTADQERGVVIGVLLDHHDLLGSDLEGDPQLQVVTTHPDFPHDPSLTFESPFLEARMVFGDDFDKFTASLARFFQGIDELWPDVERAYGYYLREDWTHFDGVMSKVLGPDWADPPTELDRHDRIHRLLSIILMPLAATASYPAMKEEVWATAQVDVGALRKFAQDPMNMADIKSVQRRIFDQIRRMIDIRDAWRPALGLAFLHESGKVLPERWRLPGDNFHLLRDAYRQNFELACQGLFMLVASKNTQDGRPAKVICAADYSAGWVPSWDKTSMLPRTVQQFKGKRAEIKELYLEGFPTVHEVWEDVFSRRLRNGIAHADIEFVTTSGMVLSDQDEFSYLDFVRATIAQLQLLMLLIDFAKLLRIYAS